VAGRSRCCTWAAKDEKAAADPAGQVLLRVYVDGHPKPAIEGPLDKLFRDAETKADSGVPMPAFIFNRSYNLYVPIPFSAGIRIEAEAVVDLFELFVQIDYRQTGKAEAAPRQQLLRPAVTRQSTVATGEKGIIITGPAILRRLEFRGQGLDDLELQIFWDDEPTPAVQAPLRYFFGGFNNAAVESEPTRVSTWFPMPFRQRVRLRLLGSGPAEVAVSYDIEEQAQLPLDVRYFHVLYHDEAATNGVDPYVALETQGAGHFVGVNLFETGPNHGGGDTAVIDTATRRPCVLHGINGEDYFGFAWHDTGRMNPLGGAPVHERRYRLHLENPYPFQESLRFSFWAFAGCHPRSVAFWYQEPGHAAGGAWQAVDVPWNVLGPLTPGAPPPERPDALKYKTEVPLFAPVRFEVQWQQAQMRRGILDLTYFFRHSIEAKDGCGFAAGRNVHQLVTYVQCEEKQMLRARFGHDDAARVFINGKLLADLQRGDGVRADEVTLPLNKGWNVLTVTLENGENVNWRWCGLTLALKQPAGVRFALKPE